MIWHIFKKDWKLLWRMVVGVALANVMFRVTLARAALREDISLLELANLLGVIAFFATGMLIVLAVHQDAIPGLRQDWLVRPIQRKDLLLSKLLFVVLLVQGPIFLTELGHELTAGLPVGPSIGTALSRSIWMLLAMDLPCLALASLTRNLVEAIGAALVTLVGFMFLDSTAGQTAPTRFTGMIWVTESAQVAWGLVAVAIVLTLQYRRRKTVPARWTFGGAMVVWIVLEFLPWQTAFAIQERLSPQPATANSIHIGFEPSLGKEHRAPGSSESIRVAGNRRERDLVVFIPLRIDGLGSGRILTADQAAVHLTGRDGRAIEFGEFGPGARTDTFREGAIHQALTIQEDGYRRIKDQPLRLQIDYSLTLQQAEPAQSMPALAGDRWIRDLGRCTTGGDATGAQIELHCVAPRKVPCTDWWLENPGTGLRIEPARKGRCSPDYAPFILGIGSLPGARFEATFPLHGGADESQLKDARVVSLVYRPEAHFTRQVVIRDIRLSDWEPE
jgi:hypothetical protein